MASRFGAGVLPIRSLDAETFRADASGRLLEIGGKTSEIEEIEGQYMGLLKFTPRGVAERSSRLLAELEPQLATGWT